MVKTDRSFWTVLLLSIITCGIYGIVFWYNYTEDVNVVCRRDGKKYDEFHRCNPVEYGYLRYLCLGVVLSAWRTFKRECTGLRC